MSVIEIKELTRDFGNGKGIFDVSFNVEKGEVLGFLGPNGAGKTTTIRHIMGFFRAEKGSVLVNGMDALKDADRIQKNLGYLPGEIAFMNNMEGREFIEFVRNMKGVRDRRVIDSLMERFELDPTGPISRMSKGMKQKVGIVCAFMNDPEILVLDEPTSGLDPLMQATFVDLINEEAGKGKTILMSSHMFEEVEKTCHRTAIIRQGRIVAVEDKDALIESLGREYSIRFRNRTDLDSFIRNRQDARVHGMTVNVNHMGDVDTFIKELAGYSIEDLESERKSLEDIFMHFYGGDR